MNKTILAVDDSVSIRLMVSATLESAGYTVVQASDGVEALDYAKRHHVDMVLTDQNMPRMDGLQLVRSLREMPSYAGVPIVVLTTEGGDAMKAAGRAARATGWIVKPFNPETLIQVVKKVLA